MGKIVFLTENKSVHAQRGDKLIDICAREKLDMPFGCENAECGVCVGVIRKGAANLNKISDAERATLELFSTEPNHRLICQCKLEKDGDVEFERA